MNEKQAIREYLTFTGVTQTELAERAGLKRQSNVSSMLKEDGAGMRSEINERANYAQHRVPLCYLFQKTSSKYLCAGLMCGNSSDSEKSRLNHVCGANLPIIRCLSRTLSSVNTAEGA